MNTKLSQEELNSRKEYVYKVLQNTSMQRVDLRKNNVANYYVVDNNHKYNLIRDEANNIEELVIHGCGEKITEDIRKFAQQFGDDELIDIAKTGNNLSPDYRNKYNDNIRSEVHYLSETGESAQVGNERIRLPYIEIFSEPAGLQNKDITIRITDDALKSDKFMHAINSLAQDLEEKTMINKEEDLNTLPKKIEDLVNSVVTRNNDGKITNPVQANYALNQLKESFENSLENIRNEISEHEAELKSPDNNAINSATSLGKTTKEQQLSSKVY